VKEGEKNSKKPISNSVTFLLDFMSSAIICIPFSENSLLSEKTRTLNPIFQKMYF